MHRFRRKDASGFVFFYNRAGQGILIPPCFAYREVLRTVLNRRVHIMSDRAAQPIPRRTASRLTSAKPVVLAAIPHAPVPQNAACFFNGGVEPHLADMLRDPIIALVMHRDRVSADDVLSVMRAAARGVECDG
jgi:hypothetical protein